MRLLEILSLFCNKSKKFNNTGACMLDSIHQRTLKVLKIEFWGENVKIFPLLHNAIMHGHHYVLLLNL